MKAPSLASATIQAAIIDLDGTMVDTLGDFEEVLRRTMADLSLPPIGRAFLEHTIGKGSEHLIRSCLAHVGAPESSFDAAWARYQHHYPLLNGDHAEVFPGVVEGLTAMRRRGWKLGCLTNKPLAFARPLLEKKGLAPFFEVVFGGDSFARKKPDPLPLIETCKALGTDPSRTLMVGDSSNDAQAARAAGCPVLLVSYGYNHGQPVSMVESDGIVDRLDDVFG